MWQPDSTSGSVVFSLLAVFELVVTGHTLFYVVWLREPLAQAVGRAILLTAVALLAAAVLAALIGPRGRRLDARCLRQR